MEMQQKQKKKKGSKHKSKIKNSLTRWLHIKKYANKSIALCFGMFYYLWNV